MTQTLTIATRQSPLALWQANFVKNQLQKHHPNLKIRLLELVTRGDKILDTPLAKIGGKGLFVKELEQALLEGRADIAVHSLKDVPMVLPEGLILSTYCQRHTPTDAFVSRYFTKLEDLPEGASVGTSSLRRECQLRAYRPDLQIKSLRGNVGTRLAKLDEGKYDAIVLATSGLERLGLQARIRHQLSTDISLPAVGQGILAIESRQDTDLLARMAVLDDTKTRLCAIAERALNRTLEGGCQVPIAGFATLEQDTLHLSGRVGQVNGQKLLQAKQSLQLTGTLSDQQQQAEQLGMAVAQNLLEQGAYAILSLLYSK